MKIFYFGCWGEAGHYFVDPYKQTVRESDTPFRKGYFLDGGPFLPRPEKKGTGAITHCPNWTVLAWWGSPCDARGAVCASVIVEGRKSADEVWALFEEHFPSLASKLERPSIREGKP